MAISLNLRALQFIDFQNPNTWEFYITGVTAGASTPINFKFHVIDTTLPFEKLETETRNTGSKHVIGFTPVEGFSITFRENTDFDVYNYFDQWKNQVYDTVRKVFRTGPNKTRTGILAFQRQVGDFFKNAYNKVYEFRGLRFTGFEDKALDYNTQDALTLTVNFVVDEVRESSLVGPTLGSAVDGVGQFANDLRNKTSLPNWGEISSKLKTGR